jgi:hypothetical protein
MNNKSLADIIRGGMKTESTSQYKSLNNAIRSIYNRQVTPEQKKDEQPSDEELAVIQNRKIQAQRKIIDNA